MTKFESGVDYYRLLEGLKSGDYNMTDDSLATASMLNIAADIVVRNYGDFDRSSITIDVDIYIKYAAVLAGYASNTKYDRTIHMYDNINDMPDKEFMFINDIITIIGKAVEAHANK